METRVTKAETIRAQGEARRSALRVRELEAALASSERTWKVSEARLARAEERVRQLDGRLENTFDWEPRMLRAEERVRDLGAVLGRNIEQLEASRVRLAEATEREAAAQKQLKDANARAVKAISTRDEHEGELWSLRKQLVGRTECEAAARQQVDVANARAAEAIRARDELEGELGSLREHIIRENEKRAKQDDEFATRLKQVEEEKSQLMIDLQANNSSRKELEAHLKQTLENVNSTRHSRERGGETMSLESSDPSRSSEVAVAVVSAETALNPTRGWKLVTLAVLGVTIVITWIATREGCDHVPIY